MERVQELIDKLYEQRRRNDAPAQLLATVQQLHDILMTATLKHKSAHSEKVAVIFPEKFRVTEPAPAVAQEKHIEVLSPIEENVPEVKPVVIETFSMQPAPLEEKQEPQAQSHSVVVTPPSRREEYILQKPIVTEQPAQKPPPPAQAPPPAQPQPPQPEPKGQPNLFDIHFDAMEEAPTLLQQGPRPAPKEIHELISEPKESLNDKLKQERTELSNVLKDTPIKDLRKAIGINDKFLFVNELFRGDEAMYERSIKTINGFHILPEAEYWINRELKVKLGWIDSSSVVQHFYHLVRRRFS